MKKIIIGIIALVFVVVLLIEVIFTTSYSMTSGQEQYETEIYFHNSIIIPKADIILSKDDEVVDQISYGIGDRDIIRKLEVSTMEWTENSISITYENEVLYNHSI